MRLFLVMLAAIPVAGGSWTPRALAQYARLRAGRAQGEPVVWRGRGTLSNTVTGAHIAEVESLERVERTDAIAPSVGFSSERVLVYRDANGTRLTRFGRRLVPTLRYRHNVLLGLVDGQLLLSAVAPDGRKVASGWDSGSGPYRAGPLRGSAFGIALRPLPRDGAAKAAAPPPPPRRAVRGTRRSHGGHGAPRVADAPAGSGAARESYTLRAPRAPGCRCSLSYTRTGRCPSWYGAGLCTLELECDGCREARPPWWRRLLGGRATPPWDEVDDEGR